MSFGLEGILPNLRVVLPNSPKLHHYSQLDKVPAQLFSKSCVLLHSLEFVVERGSTTTETTSQARPSQYVAYGCLNQLCLTSPPAESCNQSNPFSFRFKDHREYLTELKRETKIERWGWGMWGCGNHAHSGNTGTGTGTEAWGALHVHGLLERQKVGQNAEDDVNVRGQQQTILDLFIKKQPDAIEPNERKAKTSL